MARDRSNDQFEEDVPPKRRRPPAEERLHSGTPRDKRPDDGPRRQGDDDRPRRRDDDRPRRRPPTDDDGALSTLIPYKNALALAAYYTGVFSLIPGLGLLLGIVAFVLGCMGLNYVRRHPEAKGTGHAIAGMVLGAITVLGHLIFIVLFFVVLRR